MANYKVVNLQLTEAITCISFSCWDNTAGPVPKCVWASTTAPQPEPANIKLLTRLTLKTEVTRDPGNSDIDCNIYSLPELSVCAVSYVFGATCKAKPGKTIYCLTYLYKLEQRSMYLQWAQIIDSFIKHKITEYKVILHQDFKAGDMSKSNSQLLSIVSASNELFSRLEKTKLGSSSCKSTYFLDFKNNEELVWLAVNATLTSFCRAVVVGNSEKLIDKVNKWVKTLSMTIPRQFKDCCFMCTSVNEPIIPNALIQGIISTQDLWMNKEFLLSLYTLCDYPLAVIDLNKRKVYHTSCYERHLVHQDMVRERRLLDLMHLETNTSTDDVLMKTRGNVVRCNEEAPVLLTLREQLQFLPPISRCDYITQYMTYLHSKASVIIEHLSSFLGKESESRMSRPQLIKYQMIDKGDVEVLLCLSEFSHPGIYDAVDDDSVDRKLEKISQAI